MTERERLRPLASVRAPLPIDEAGRLAAVRRIAPVAADAPFDDIVEVARGLLDMPVVVISLVDAKHVRALAGAPSDWEVLERSTSLAAHAILADRSVEVEDVRIDQRFRGTKRMLGDQPVVSFVGAAIRTPDGHAVGVIAGMDVVPRTIDASRRRALEGLADLVAQQLEGAAIVASLLYDGLNGFDLPSSRETESYAPLSGMLQAAVDHAAWPIAWAHLRIEGEYQVAASVGIDPSDLDTGLALYEMRHRLQQHVHDGNPYRLDASEVPTSLGRLASEAGVAEFLVVPISLTREVDCVLVFGSRVAWVSPKVLLRGLGQEARRLAASVQATWAATAVGETPDQIPSMVHLRAIDDVRERVRVGIGEYIRAALLDADDLAPQRVRPFGISEDLDVADLLARVTGPVVAAHRRKVALTLRLETVRADVDRERLGRAVSELVDNAVRHNPAGTSVNVSLARVGDDRFRIVVTDDGLGVPDQIKQRLFQPAPDDDGYGHQAMGVGLGMVAAVAALHRGRCWVQDTPGGGAAFVLDLPFTMVDAPAQPEELVVLHLVGPDDVRSPAGT